MKFALKMFFKLVRIVMHPLMLLWEFLTTPKGVVRAEAVQQQIDAECRQLVLYQFKTCPFCIKVRKEMARLSLPIAVRDAQKNQLNRAELLQGGGQVKVPCLQIADGKGNVQWLYESGEIIRYLQQRFAASQTQV
jgi:glutaredoxin